MSVRRALGVSATAQLAIFVLGFISVVVVSRLLTPAEIGVFSVAVSVLGFAHVFREFGVGQYLIQAKKVGRPELRAAFSVTLFFSWSIALILFIARVPLANFYAHEGISAVLELLSLNFVLMPFGTPLLSLLQRELKFGTLAIVKVSNAFLSTAVTIGAALAGESYLSMAWGAIAGHVGNIVMLNFIRRGEIFMLPSFKGLREVIRFGSISSVVSLLSELGASAPDLIFGRTLGFSDVAYFSRATGLRKMVLGQLTTLVSGVYFPSFAQKIRDGQSAAELYCRTMNYMVALIGPGMALLALLSEPLITFLFGVQWVRAAPLASLLCLYSIITAPYSLANLSLVATGNVERVLKVQIITQTLRTAILLSSIWLDLERVVPTLGVVFVAEAVLYQRALGTTFNLGFYRLLREVRSAFMLIPFTVCGPALIFYVWDPSQPGPLHLLGFLLLAGAIALFGWLLGLLVADHPLKSEILTLASRLRIAK
jgi:O-antigen/teichoic acid export membrane protein